MFGKDAELETTINRFAVLGAEKLGLLVVNQRLWPNSDGRDEVVLIWRFRVIGDDGRCLLAFHHRIKLSGPNKYVYEPQTLSSLTTSIGPYEPQTATPVRQRGDRPRSRNYLHLNDTALLQSQKRYYDPLRFLRRRGCGTPPRTAFERDYSGACRLIRETLQKALTGNTHEPPPPTFRPGGRIQQKRV